MQTKPFKISSGKLSREIKLPRSKSFANRLLILAALSDKETVITDLPLVDDVRLLLDCLKQVGVHHRRIGNKDFIMGPFPLCRHGREEMVLEVGEGGTTARFLASLLALDDRPYKLKLLGKLHLRPWEELLEALRSLKVKIELKNNELSLCGPALFEKKVMATSAKRSTQFATSLALAFSKSIKIIPKGMTSSMSYWSMTEDLIKAFNLSSERQFTVPVDWSGASYPVCFAALTQETYFPGLHYDHHQADAKLFDLLNRLGGIKSVSEKGIIIQPLENRLQDIVIDVHDCLDLVPALSFFLSHIKGVHSLKGVRNLIHKESDRLTEIRSLLSFFDRFTEYDEKNDVLTIKGSTDSFSGAPLIETAPDHRMVMTAALFLRLHSGGDLLNTHCIEKSFKDFFGTCGF